MSFPAAGRASTIDADLAIIQRIVSILEARRGGRTYEELAAEIGVGRPMLRKMHLYGATPGADTLSILLDWDRDTFEPLVLDYLQHRGSLLRGKSVQLA